MTYRVLLCVSGMSPAIITETLFALLTEPEPFLPREIHVVTTTQGKAKIMDDLLSSTKGVLYPLLADYWPADQPLPVFDADTIHVIQSMDDINSEVANRIAGDCIFQVFHGIQQGYLLRCAVNERAKGVRIHASIAGGRKTMSFLMGHAFSLLAEPQDELSHVLVNTPFEDPRLGFFFPPKEPRMMGVTAVASGEKKLVSTADARVMLGRITALKLGKQWMPAKWLEADAALQKGSAPRAMTLDMAVRLANARYQPEPMELQIVQGAGGSTLHGIVRVCGMAIPLSPMEFAVMAFFAIVKVQARQTPERMCVQVAGLPIELWETLTRDFKTQFKADKKPDMETLISRLHGVLADHLGQCAQHYMLQPIGKKKRGYNRPLVLNTSADLIAFVGEDDWDVDWWQTIKKCLASPAGQAATQGAWAAKSN